MSEAATTEIAFPAGTVRTIQRYDKRRERQGSLGGLRACRRLIWNCRGTALDCSNTFAVACRCHEEPYSNFRNLHPLGFLS